MAQSFFVLALCLGALVYIAHAVLVDRKKLPGFVNRLLSQSNAGPSKKAAKAPAAVDYSRVFPPTHRTVLAELVSPEAAPVSEPSAAELQEGVLDLDVDYRLADPSRFIFSGFSVGDVHRLGDFPDYAKLSGVPLPSPLEDFDVDKALPRPYRPFRWAYHQTMCT